MINMEYVLILGDNTGIFLRYIINIYYINLLDCVFCVPNHEKVYTTITPFIDPGRGYGMHRIQIK
jgi:hypothetical protein